MPKESLKGKEKGKEKEKRKLCGKPFQGLLFGTRGTENFTQCLTMKLWSGANFWHQFLICILTRPVVITGFNWSLLVDWWLIEKIMVDVKILSISYPNLLDSTKQH